MLRLRARVVSPTPIGPVTVLWRPDPRAPRVVRILLPAFSRAAPAPLRSAPGSSCGMIEGLARRIESSLMGERVDFSLDPLELGSCPPFQIAVLRAVHRIPRGAVSSYGLVASGLGSPGGSRAVGNALAANPFPIVVPCHRVIRSDKRPGGFQGRRESVLKRALLEGEGIAFDRRGRAVVAALCNP